MPYKSDAQRKAVHAKKKTFIIERTQKPYKGDDGKLYHQYYFDKIPQSGMINIGSFGELNDKKALKIAKSYTKDSNIEFKIKPLMSRNFKEKYYA